MDVICTCGAVGLDLGFLVRGSMGENVLSLTVVSHKVSLVRIL